MGFDITRLSSTLNAYAEASNKVRSDKTTLAQTALFGIGSFSKVKGSLFIDAKKNALNEFKKELTGTVGETLANQAWKMAGGEKVNGLTAGLVKKTLAAANKLCAQLGPIEKTIADMWNMTVDEMRKVVNGGSGTSSFKGTCRIAVGVTRALNLVGKTPASQREVAVLKANIEQSLAEIGNLLGSDVSDGCDLCIGGDTINLSKLKTDLETKLKTVDKEFANLPGREPLPKLAQDWKKTLSLAAGMMIVAAKQEKAGELMDKLQSVLNKYTEQALVDKLTANNKAFFGKGILKKTAMGKHLKLEYQIGKELEGIFKSVCGSSKMPDGRSMKNLLIDSNNEVLNRKAWTPIDKNFSVAVGGKAIVLQSKITPGKHIGKFLEYEEGIQGYNCHTKNTAHAVNLATTELNVGTTRVFGGVRHAAHSSEGVPNMDKAEANSQRAQETVKAAFISYLNGLTQGEAEKKSHEKEVVFNMTSISLMTPSVIIGEKEMFFDQKAAWEAVNGKPFTITVGEHTYNVKPNITMFSYGVNSGAVKYKGEPTTGWGNVSGMNRASLKALHDRAAKFVEDNPESKAGKAVKELNKQIKNIAEHKLERKDGHEAYKMASRIAVMSYLMGDVPVWNCKSGKDRTGMLDVEAKFLATLIDQEQEIPEPGAKLTEQQQTLFNTITRQSGNLEMQEYNTGAAGYKLGGVDSIKERVGTSGDHEAKATFKGGSGYVGS